MIRFIFLIFFAQFIACEHAAIEYEKDSNGNIKSQSRYITKNGVKQKHGKCIVYQNDNTFLEKKYAHDSLIACYYHGNEGERVKVSLHSPNTREESYWEPHRVTHEKYYYYIDAKGDTTIHGPYTSLEFEAGGSACDGWSITYSAGICNHGKRTGKWIAKSSHCIEELAAIVILKVYNDSNDISFGGYQIGEYVSGKREGLWKHYTDSTLAGVTLYKNDKWVKTDNNDYSEIMATADALHESHNLKKAYNNYLKAIDLARGYKDFLTSYASMAQTCYDLGNNGEALLYAEKLLKITSGWQPQHKWANKLRGKILNRPSFYGLECRENESFCDCLQRKYRNFNRYQNATIFVKKEIKNDMETFMVGYKDADDPIHMRRLIPYTLKLFYANYNIYRNNDNSTLSSEILNCRGIRFYKHADLFSENKVGARVILLEPWSITQYDGFEEYCFDYKDDSLFDGLLWGTTQNCLVYVPETDDFVSMNTYAKIKREIRRWNAR